MQVEQSMLAASNGRTVLYTTHKVSQAQLANVIIVMAQGHIVEQGTHEELLARQGEYARLFRAGIERSQDVQGKTSGVGNVSLEASAEQQELVNSGVDVEVDVQADSPLASSTDTGLGRAGSSSSVNNAQPGSSTVQREEL